MSPENAQREPGVSLIFLSRVEPSRFEQERERAVAYIFHYLKTETRRLVHHALYQMSPASAAGSLACNTTTPPPKHSSLTLFSYGNPRFQILS